MRIATQRVGELCGTPRKEDSPQKGFGGRKMDLKRKNRKSISVEAA